MKNIIKTTAYSAVALSSVAFTSAANDMFGQQNAKQFSGTGGKDLTLMEILGNILSFILTFTGIVAVAFAIYGGFQMITAGGDDDKAKKGKTTLINASIGLLVILVAYTVVGMVFTEAGNVEGAGAFISNII